MSFDPRTALASLVCMLTLASLAAANDPSPKEAESTATLPLSQILEMRKQIDEAAREAAREKEVAPPLSAAVHSIELSGRLLEDAVEFKAQYDIQVLADEAWVEIPLISIDAQTHILDLPDVGNDAFAVVDGTLRFITKKRGRYRFELSLLKEAKQEGAERKVELKLGDSSVSICRLSFDESLFKLSNTRILTGPDGVLVFPSQEAYSITWVVEETKVGREVRKKPEIVSVIPTAHASSVSTLDGKRITRLRYQLRFAGHKTISFTIPDDQRVERAYLNGFVAPVEMQGRTVNIDAVPAIAGGETATVELVMLAEDGAYQRASSLAWSLPEASWPIHEIFLNLHLPEPFTYEWRSGSLSPAAGTAMPAFTYKIPLPGKRMSFHQYLVGAQTPDVRLDYAEEPEIASMIPAAYASSVSTLEGKRVTRLLYRLQFTGRKSITFTIPADQVVERAYLNGLAVPLEMAGRELSIEATPQRADDESATIELVMLADDGVYHLSGNLELGLPKASWPIHEVFLDLHLPDVFTYEWRSGSLSPTEQRAMPAFAYQVPLPGKQMSFQQYLVTSHAPHVRLDYAVDLESQYFSAQ